MIEFGSQLEHEKYEELCALATAGVLTPAESEVLSRHLEVCAPCTEVYAQYRDIAAEGIPFLADHFAARPSESEEFNESSALARLMQATEEAGLKPASTALPESKKHIWNQAWVRGMTAACLVASVGVGAYRTGEHSAKNRLLGKSSQSQYALERAIAEKQAVERAVRAGKQMIAVLGQQAVGDKNDIAKLQAAVQEDARRLAGLTDAMNVAKKEADARLAALTVERDTNMSKLHDVEGKYQSVQDELNTLRGQHQQDLVHLVSLETRVTALSGELNDQNRRAKTDEQYLASDKDIRDLIGARNLYIADIMDVNETGQSRRPFGRVFYTKTKSLIFYAYDLDRQPGVKRTSTFQVWGRTSPNDRKPLKLGILYMDSETNRRWTLRVDDPEQLARLEAVFVTVEPHEQADKPTGKPFLYASLRREPNHP